MSGPDPRTPRPAHLPSPPLQTRVGHATLRAASRLLKGYPILLEYPPADPMPPRWGAGAPPNRALHELLIDGAARYREMIALIESYASDLGRISVQPAGRNEPYWNQLYFTGLDAAALYALVRDRKPARYHEIGSGNSTLFVARAIRDGALSTRVLCVDPEPRAGIDDVCDELVRQPFELVAPARIAALQAGDMLFLDSSHVVLQNSDVVAFVLDVLPELPPGVLVGIHDIFLPDDYPWWLSDRGYGEQYLFGAWLLGARPVERLVMASHLCATDPSLRPELDATWERSGLPGIAYGSALWFET